MEELLNKIRSCEVCKAHLPHGPRPIIAGHPDSKIVLVGQAPGSKVHQTGIPWDDPSGRQLRKWLGVDEKVFYDETKMALIPMGFCYPGKGRSGDMPPRPECAPLWHTPLLEFLADDVLFLLIGSYAQAYYLRDAAKATLTDTVRHYKDYLPNCIPLPHPSPRNRFWLSRNPWFEKEVLPSLRAKIASALI